MKLVGIGIVTAGTGTIIGYSIPFQKIEESSSGGGSSVCPNCPHEGTLKTEVLVDGKLIVTYNRGLTDQEANSILDKNFDRDVTFRAFGWREY